MFFLTAITVGGVLILREAVQVGRENDDRLFDSTQAIPTNRVGLVLGCSPKVRNGNPNQYFHKRMKAAAELYRAGKVEFLLASGDNATRHYDEPTAMRAALIDLGVPEERIFLDYAGFRTFDSVVRANRVFGQHSLTVISQEFQNRRALYIARHLDLDMIAFNAGNVSGLIGFRSHIREFLARVKMVLDLYFLGTEPKFLGEPVVIG